MQSPSLLSTPSSRLAYHKQEGALPTVMFCTGFKSDMTGSKAQALAAHCAARGQSFVRFDYSGHGASSGKFEEGTIGGWKADTLAVLDALAGDEVILVGSSMGAWLALLVALERPEKIKALIGVASAPDFTERLIWNKLVDSQRSELLKNGVFYAPSCYGEAPYPITLRLIEEARQHLLLTSPSPLLGEGMITCPLHLLHGTKDEDVPLEIPHLLKEKIPHATLTLIEGGNHRLSEPGDLTLLCQSVNELTIAA